MKVLVGCEESQVVCKVFRDKGHVAYSCDFLPTRGKCKWHFRNDVMDIISLKRWDLIILHPDCTAMAVSGNRWYASTYEREKMIRLTLDMWELAIEHCNKVALENPVSVIWKHLPNVHYIQPWQFGQGETKKTGFALHNLPPLKPTNIVDGREQRVWKMSPSKNRKRDRAVTYQGVAEAMASQWGK